MQFLKIIYILSMYRRIVEYVLLNASINDPRIHKYWCIVDVVIIGYYYCKYCLSAYTKYDLCIILNKYYQWRTHDFLKKRSQDKNTTISFIKKSINIHVYIL